MKNILIFAMILLLNACNLPKKPIDEDFGSKDPISKKDLLSVKSVEDARIKARKAFQGKKIDLAQAYYVKAFAMEPENISLLQEMTMLYKILNKNDLVELCYQLILKENPKHYESLEQYGLLLIKLKKYPQAEEKLMQVLVANEEKDNWRVVNGLGLVNDLQGNYKLAILYFSQALEINPNHIDVINNIAFSMYRSKRYQEAVKYYQQALAINPKHTKVLYNYALLNARIKKYRLSISLFSRLMEPAEAYNNVGYIAMKNGDLEQAENYLLQATQLSTRHYKKAYENLHQLKIMQTNKSSIFR